MAGPDAFPVVAADEIGWLTEAQMVEVDRVMIEDLDIGLIQMMENAGRNLAALVIDRFGPATVTVLAGSGGNGGGGLAAARHMANRGVEVSITLGKPADSLGEVPGRQLEIARRMGLPIRDRARPADVVVDALIGYSLRGAPRGLVGQLIEAVPGLGTAVVSLDTPSGLDVTDGSSPGAAVRADATLTLALPKIGLRGAPPVGELYVADISVPPSVHRALGAGPPPDFRPGPILRVI